MKNSRLITQSIKQGIPKIRIFTSRVFHGIPPKIYSQSQTNNDEKMETLFKSLNLPTVTESQNKAFASQITKEEIYAAIARLKANKSPGMDGFTTEWYKSLKEALTPVLLRTFNWVLLKGETPAL